MEDKKREPAVAKAIKRVKNLIKRAIFALLKQSANWPPVAENKR